MQLLKYHLEQLAIAKASTAPTNAIANEVIIGTNLDPEKNPITGGN